MPEFTPSQIDQRIMSDEYMQRLAQEDETEFKVQHAKIYDAFGYHPDGTPHSRAKRAIKGVASAAGMPEGLVHGIAAAPLPIAGTIAGMAVGSGGGPVGAAIGASGGSVLGEAANSLLGISEPMDTVDMGIAAAAPLLGPAASRAKGLVTGIGKRITPGAGAGLNELAGEKFTQQLQSMRVTPEMVAVARRAMNNAPDFMLHVPHTKALFNDETAEVAKEALLEIPDSDLYLKALNRVIEASGIGTGKKINFKDLMTLETGFNRIKSEKPQEIWAAAAGTLIKDLEAAAADPLLRQSTIGKAAQGLDAFKKFIAINNKHLADETFVKAMTVDGGILKSVAGDSSMVQFDKKAFHKFLNTNAKLNKAYTPEEIASIRASVDDLGYISKPPEAGASLGKRYGAGGIIGGILGWASGAGAMIGAPAGMATEELLRTAFSTETGRRVVKALAIKGQGKVNSLELESMLGKALAGASAGLAGASRDVPPGITPFGNEQ